MNKPLIASLLAVSMLVACSPKSEVPTLAPAGAASAPVVTEEVKPQVVAPKPPPPPGGGKSAPELSPADIARIQAMLKKQADERKTAVQAASAPAQ